ncbi:MAG: hypothetical protein NT001_00645 [Candidatus Woesearchaeota archaeon]|nr:hypothetical protein [Candidatus Woesearchaeota archaeon]
MAKGISIPTDKIVAWFKALPQTLKEFFGDLPDTIKNAPIDEKIAYGVIIVGLLFLIVGIVL